MLFLAKQLLKQDFLQTHPYKNRLNSDDKKIHGSHGSRLKKSFCDFRDIRVTLKKSVCDISGAHHGLVYQIRIGAQLVRHTCLRPMTT